MLNVLNTINHPKFEYPVCFRTDFIQDYTYAYYIYAYKIGENQTYNLNMYCPFTNKLSFIGTITTIIIPHAKMS